ncbi:hypothetical protein [Paenibacillus flagellatus]|uniref:hypothetical protein n=1 Tax=Paenibacillus flagellatus TaxID=2211139 RepID=UPI001305350E|nr:hypothetical protein [Paenibacillus flagellatus]
MNKNDIREMIRSELKENPSMTSIELALKCRLPLRIVELFRHQLAKEESPAPHP